MRTGGTVCSAILSNTFVYCCFFVSTLRGIHVGAVDVHGGFTRRQPEISPSSSSGGFAALFFFFFLICAAKNKNCFITKLSHFGLFFTTRRPSFPNTLLDENALTSVSLQSCLAVSVSQGTEDFLLGADERQNLQRT